MDKLEMTPEQQLAFDGFIDVMVQIYKMTSDKIDYSNTVIFCLPDKFAQNEVIKYLKFKWTIVPYDIMSTN